MKSQAAFLLLAGCLIASLHVSSAAKKIPKREPKDLKLTDTPTQSTLSIRPVNLFAYQGGVIMLVCEAQLAPPDSRVQWWEFVTNTGGQMISDNSVILSSHPNAARYHIDTPTPRTFNLIIIDVDIRDGGSYLCINSNGFPPDNRGQADLVVLEADPNCTSLIPPNGVVMENQNYTVTCEIRFGGNMLFAPDMTWTGPPPFLTSTNPSGNKTFSGVTFTVNRSFDTKAYQCHTNFSDPGPQPPGVAGNAPEYNHYYQSPQMFVYWGPTNMSASPIQATYAPGDLITCNADAFPPAFFQWQNMRTLEVFSSQIYNVTASDQGFNFTLRCQAQNLIQGFLYSATHFINITVPAPTTTPVPTTTTTPPAVANCQNLTGWWLSETPYAELYIAVAAGTSGQVTGFMRNATDQQWVEVIGRTRISTYDYLGLSSILPYDIGITGLAGECHRCSGVEILITGGLWRSRADTAGCGHGGTPSPNVAYYFNKLPNPMYDMHDTSFRVHKPTRHISGSYGIAHLDYED